jgi:hypothetical protein
MPWLLYHQGEEERRIGGWVNPRASLDNMENRKFLTIPGLKLQPLGHPACSQSLYRLCYHLISRCYPEIYLEALQKTMRNLIQVSLCPSQNSKQVPLKYKYEALSIVPMLKRSFRTTAPFLRMKSYK